MLASNFPTALAINRIIVDKRLTLIGQNSNNRCDCSVLIGRILTIVVIGPFWRFRMADLSYGIKSTRLTRRDEISVTERDWVRLVESVYTKKCWRKFIHGYQLVFILHYKILKISE